MNERTGNWTVLRVRAASWDTAIRRAQRDARQLGFRVIATGEANRGIGPNSHHWSVQLLVADDTRAT